MLDYVLEELYISKLYIYIYSYIYKIVTTTEERWGINLKVNAVHGRIWRNKRKGGNVIIIWSQKQKKKIK